MNGLDAVAAAASRLLTQEIPRAVYSHGVPDGTLPTRYLVVWGADGSEEATRAADTVDALSLVVWVTSVSRNADGQVAAHEAAWGASRARAALRNYRPEGRWAFRAESSSPARRDESIPDTTFYAVEQFRLRSTV